MTDLDRIKHLAGLQEDSVDMEKHNTLNDIFMALERLNSEVDELDSLDRDEDSSGVGDLTDQLTTMRKHIGALYQVLDRSGRIVPMESTEEVKEAVNQALIDSVVDQIIKDLDMGDQTAIEELLMSVPEHNLRGFLSDYGGNPSESVSEASLSLDKAKEYFFRDHDFGEENIGYEYDRISKRMTPEDAIILKKELQDMYGDSMSESNAVSDLKKLAGL